MESSRYATLSRATERARPARILLFWWVAICLSARWLLAAPDWAADAIWYQIFPERFRNGDRANDPDAASLEGTWPYETPAGWRVSPWTSDWYALQPWERANGKGFYYNTQLRRYGGDLQGIIDQLDYLGELGVNALYLNPIFESASLHKYGATMYHHVDKHFGPDPKGDAKLVAAEDAGNPATWKWSAADQLFLKLIAETHRRGMRIIIDGVFNHTGIPFWALQRARKEGPKSAYADWFHIVRWDDPATPEDEFDYRGWSGAKDLPEFNRNATNLVAGVRQHLHEVVRRWMDPNGDGDPSDGIDGWRLDVAAEVPMGFWVEFRSWVKAIRPNAYLTGEIWWQDFNRFTFRNARPWLDEAFDGVMNYRFGDAVFQFLNQPDRISPSQFGGLLRGMQGEYGYERGLGLQNLYGSHDTARLGSAVVNPRLRQDHGASVAEHHEYATRGPVAAEVQRWKQMVAFQFLAPGAPFIYYGDEVGMWGADDPDCRKPMVWGDLQYDAERARPFGPAQGGEEVQVNKELLSFYRECIARRNRLTVLRRGDFRVLLADDATGVFGFRRDRGPVAVAAFFNSGDAEVRMPLAKSRLGADEGWRDGATDLREVVVPAHWFKVLERGTR